MRYLILLALTLTAAQSMADDSENQYIDATDTIKAAYEIINNRGKACDAALDDMGVNAIKSKDCVSFIDTDDLINSVSTQCKVVIHISEGVTAIIKEKHEKGVLTKVELRAFQEKGNFLKEYCGSRPPSRYKFISKTFKKIQLMGD
jgi:hypothetical protein